MITVKTDDRQEKAFTTFKIDKELNIQNRKEIPTKIVMNIKETQQKHGQKI